MRAIYDPYIKRWSVKGLGYFNTRAEAKEAIKESGLSEIVSVRLKPKTKQQLEELAEQKNMSAMDFVRLLIEKEVTKNGN